MINFPEIAINLKNMPSDEIATVMEEWGSARDADSEDRKRLVDNIKFTGGLPDDMYDSSEAKDLDRQGRDRQQYNLVQYYVNGCTGNMIMNGIDPKFIEPSDDEKKLRAVTKLQNVYYADKNKFNYKNSAQQCARNGAIGCGVEELVIDRTSDPRGRIRFISHNPLNIIRQQINTDDITRGTKKIWKEFYLTAEEMYMFYPNMDTKIKKSIKAVEKTFKDMAEKAEHLDSAEFVSKPKGRIGKKYLCVEAYEIKYEKQEVVIDVMTGTVLPKTPYEMGTPEDFITKQLWAQEKGIEIDPSMLTTWQQLVPTMYTRTFCSELALVLENRKDERQLEGNLPFYFWSFIMLNGKMIGIADLAKEAQKDFNSREMQKTKLFTQTPMQKSWVHASMFGDQTEKKRGEFVENFNDSSRVEMIPDDVPLGVMPFGIMQGAQIPSSLFQDESFKLSLLNLICFLPPVLQGQGKGGDSGVLFGRKVIEANVVLQMPAKNFELHEHYKATDWKMMAVQIYGGRTKDEKIANMNRKFSEGLSESVTINQHVGNDSETGEPIIEDDISILKDTEIIITQSKENDYMKQAKRELNVASMQAMAPTPQNDGMRSIFETNLARAMDYSDQDEKKDAEEMCDLRVKIAKATQELQLKKLLQELNAPAIAPGTPSGVPPQGGQPQGPPSKALAPSGHHVPVHINNPSGQQTGPMNVQNQQGQRLAAPQPR